MLLVGWHWSGAPELEADNVTPIYGSFDDAARVIEAPDGGIIQMNEVARTMTEHQHVLDALTKRCQVCGMHLADLVMQVREIMEQSGDDEDPSESFVVPAKE